MADRPNRPPGRTASTTRLRRPRLLQVLGQRFEHQLTVLIAGAGYGKTTLLEQAIAENALDRRGLDRTHHLTARDRDPEHLLRSIGMALGDHVDDTTDVDDVVDRLVLAAPESVALVLDDAHVLDGSPSWAILGELLARLPSNAHLVLAGRTRPPLPMRRLQAAGAALVLTSDDVALDAAERAALAALLGASDAVAADLPPWPALAVLTIRAGTSASIEYLWEQLLAELPEDRRSALATVAEFETVDDELVRAVTADRWSAAELIGDLPLVDVVGDQHRFHALWNEALTGLVTADVLAASKVRGAEVLVARGELVRAIAAYGEAGAWDAAHGVVRRMVSRSIGAELSRADARAALDLLRPEDRATPIGLSLETVIGWTAQDAPRALRSLLDAARAAGDDELRSLALWRLVQLGGETDPASVSVDAELAELAAQGWPLARSAVILARSHEAEQRGDIDDALLALDDLHGLDPRTRRAAVAARLVALGHPERLGVTLAEILDEGLGDPVAAQAVWLRGDVDPDVAWPIAADLPGRYARRDLAAVDVPLLGVLASVALTAGDTDAARALADAATAAAPLVVPRAQHFAGVADALVTLCEEGEAAAAERFAALVDALPLDPWPPWPYLAALTPIRALLPGTEWLDDLPFGPSLRTAVDAGRALRDLRDGAGTTRAAELPWSSPELLRVHVPPPLLCELAVAADATPGAAALLERLPHRARWLRDVAGRDGDTAARARLLAADHPVRPPYDLHIAALGRLEITRNDGVAVGSLDRLGRPRQLLAHLVVARSIPRSTLAAQIWPDLPPEAAATNLRVTLVKLLDLLEPDRPRDGAWTVRSDGDRLVLADEGVTVDVDAFDAHVRAARVAEQRGTPSVAFDHLRAAHDTYGGELLPGVDHLDVLHERIRLHALAYGVTCRLAELQLVRGEPELALRYAVDAQHLDPLGQRAHRVSISCQMAIGASASARSSAARLRSLLHDADLRLEPETRQLFERVGA